MSLKEYLISSTKSKLSHMDDQEAVHHLYTIMDLTDSMYETLVKIGFKDEDQDYMLRQLCDFIDWCDHERYKIQNTVYITYSDERK